MTYQDDSTLSTALLEQLSAQGMDALPDLFRVLLNAAMQIERQRHIGAAPHERTEQRTGHANGFKDKTLATRVGQVTVSVPQVREGGFYPQALERGARSERALKLALAEMYVQGVSTRKVAAITERLSSTQVSQAAQELDATLEAWRSRPLGACPYLFLDARYEKVRQGGLVQDAAVLIAVGVDEAGKRCRIRCVRRPVRAGGPLAAVPAGPGVARPAGRAARHQRRPRGAEGGAAGRLRRRSLAAVPVPPAAERQCLRPKAGHEGAGRGGHPCGLRRPGQGRGRRAAQAGGAEVRSHGPETGRLAGGEPARRPGGVRLPRGPPPPSPRPTAACSGRPTASSGSTGR